MSGRLRAAALRAGSYLSTNTDAQFWALVLFLGLFVPWFTGVPLSKFIKGLP